MNQKDETEQLAEQLRAEQLQARASQAMAAMRTALDRIEHRNAQRLGIPTDGRTSKEIRADIFHALHPHDGDTWTTPSTIIDGSCGVTARLIFNGYGPRYLPAHAVWVACENTHQLYIVRWCNRGNEECNERAFPQEDPALVISFIDECLHGKH